MNTLRLLIAPGWPHTHRECRWALHSANGELLQHGHSEPRHWPGVVAPDGDPPADGRRASLSCDLILLGNQASAFAVRLPRGAAGRRPEVIGAALEECLLDDPESYQFARRPDMTTTDEDGLQGVAAVSRSHLAGLCTTLQGLGLSPRSAWPLGFLLPAGSGSPCAWAEAGWLTLPHPDGSFLHLALDEELANWPTQLHALGFALPGQVVDQESDEQAGLALQGAIAAGWLEATSSPGELPAAPPGGLLYGPLAPARRDGNWRQRCRLPVRLVGGLALLAATLLLADWGRLAWQAKTYRASIEQQYRATFPDGALVAPLLQMQRQLDQRRRANGQLAASDFLALLAPLGESENLALQRLDYDGQRLQVLASLPPDEIARLQDRARQFGQRLEIRQQEAAGSLINLTFSLTPDLAR